MANSSHKKDDDLPFLPSANHIPANTHFDRLARQEETSCLEIG